MEEILTFTISENDLPLTFERAVELHRKYWTFIAENELDYKPPIMFEDGDYADIWVNCFLCDYAEKHILSTPGQIICLSCPADLKIKGKELEHCLNGLYFKWFKERTAENALAIANVPMRQSSD